MPKRILKQDPNRDIRKKGRKPDSKPLCPTHKYEMEFDTARMVWACPDASCDLIAHPKTDVGGNKPTMFKGPYALYEIVDKDEGETTYLLSCQKVFFDITPHVVTISENDTEVSLKLSFETMIRIDEEGHVVNDD